MRTEQTNEKIHIMTVALLKKRGVEQPTYDQYADAAEIAAEALGAGRETLAEVLGYGATKGAQVDERTTPILARFGARGEFISDLTVDEQAFLAEAIAAEARQDAATVAAVGTGTIAAETINGEAYCKGCGMHIADFGCICQ